MYMLASSIYFCTYLFRKVFLYLAAVLKVPNTSLLIDRFMMLNTPTICDFGPINLLAWSRIDSATLQLMFTFALQIYYEVLFFHSPFQM